MNKRDPTLQHDAVPHQTNLCNSLSQADNNSTSRLDNNSSSTNVSNNSYFSLNNTSPGTVGHVTSEEEGSGSYLYSSSLPYTTILSEETNSNAPLMRSHCSRSSASIEASCRTSNCLSLNGSIDNEHLSAEEMRDWQTISRELQFELPPEETNKTLWRRLAKTLFEKIGLWEMEQIVDFQITYWDFCVIHTSDELDIEFSNEFIRYLELDGLIGGSILKNKPGQNTLKTAECILNRSTFVFILISPAFSKPGMHKPCYYDSLTNKIFESSWRNKIIPLVPSPNQIERYAKKFPLNGNIVEKYFGLKAVAGIVLGNRSDIVENVRLALNMEKQEIGNIKRKTEKKNFNLSLQMKKRTKIDELRKGLHHLYLKIGRNRFPTERLSMLCDELENLSDLPSLNETNTTINLESCREISIGPSFHFHFRS